jgi:hypothetical protein
MFTVAIATAYVGMPFMEYSISMNEMVMYFAQTKVLDDAEGQGIQILTPMNSCVLSANRETHAELFLKTNFTHLCFIDVDMGFERDVLHRLASRKLPYVGCNYPTKGKNPVFTSGALDGKSRVWTGEESTGVEECNFTGFGFALIERQVVESVKKPRFPICYDPKSEQYTTEDAPFCFKAKEAGFKIYVDHDASKRVWHMGTKAYRWSDVSKSTNEVKTNG